MSFEPLRNPLGFGPLDFIELALALFLVAALFAWPRYLAPAAAAFARRTRWCLFALALTPVALRLVLLAHHPVPTPDLYDEFGHLLVADTLRHLRLSNPPHPFARFFETFFVLQSPTYSSIYPLGSGLLLALGTFLFGLPWAGVLIATGLLCALTYWMLRAWTPPAWALLGGLLAICLFGPLNQWTNNYWGGALPAAAGCLVFGSLPRRNARLLGLGLALHILTRPYETVFLVLAVGLYKLPRRTLLAASVLPIAALALTALQNKSVTGHWTTLPYALSQYQYGVPAALTFQPNPVPHRDLTPQQQLDYRMQKGFLNGPETLRTFTDRLIFRIRYYRFFAYAPLYLPILVFLLTIRTYRHAWVALTCLIFALGINFFPAFQFHYLAAVLCLFLLMAIQGLRRLPPPAARFLILLAFGQFAFSYAAHIVDKGSYDPWTSINHTNPDRRIEIKNDLTKIPGRLLIFVRYWPQHPFQEEWVYNAADIDNQRVVWARDLGDAENQKLLAYYNNERTPLLLEPDARPLELKPWTPEPTTPEPPPPPPPTTNAPKKKPLLQLEQVR